jgi:glycosyltransferase involved in cell wall biosynthesis
MKISVVVPAYNEGENVAATYAAICQVFQNSLKNTDFEIIFVDDGSRDNTFFYLNELADNHPNVKIIKLATNYGAHMAIRAGLEHAVGDAACFIACDLQDPPSLIPKMLDALVEPVQIVWAVRNSRQDKLLNQFFARIFYALVRIFVARDFPPTGSSMFLLGSKALKAVKLYKERNLTLEGLFVTMGFQQAYVNYERQARQSGVSKWTLAKRLKLFADFFVGFSYSPIRLISYTGIIAAILGFIYALIVIFNKLFFSTPIDGWSSLMVVVLVLGGLQMVMMGIIGEYVWRALDEIRARPRYMIEQYKNIE